MNRTWLLVGGFAMVAGCGAPEPEPPVEADTSLAAAERSPPELTDASRADASDVVCRCPEQPLATFFDRASVVLMGELLAAEERGTDHLLDVRVVDRPWKVPASGDAPIEVGDTLHYVTSTSSASCGLEPRVGAIFVFFAPVVAPTEVGPRIQGCDGTRIVRDETGAPGSGFSDVPERFVASQLDALSGLDFLARAVPDTPDESDPSNDSLIGLLDIPAFTHGGWVDVRAGPSAESPVIARAESFDDLEAREVSYEVPAAVVLARIEGWYRVRLTEGRAGWISPEEAGTWFPYSELPVRRLTYLTAAWSGHVWPEPGAGIPARSGRKGSLEREEYPVEVLESMDVAGTTWFRVGVLDGDPCSGGDVGSELGGWVLGHGVGGQPTIWYYSRGC